MIAGITEKEQKIIERILDKYRKDYAFFYYGSRVKGTYEKTSDLDVLIKGKAEMPLAVLQEIKEEFDNSDLPYIVNFSDYYKLDSSFYERIKPDLIPYNWQEVKLGDVCEKVYSGGTPKSSNPLYYGGTIPWLNTKEVHFNRINKTEKYITEEGFNNSSTKWVPENSVIIAMYGATAGNIAINLIPLTTNQACCNLIIDSKKSVYKYVYYYLLYKNVELSSLANGGAQQNLNAQQIKEFKISLPPLEVQKKIAGVLGALDDKIELNNKINQNLEAQAQALFKSWFVDFEPFGGKMPDDWKIGKLGDICECLLGGTPNRNIPEFWNGNIPWINSGEVNAFRITKPSEYISELGLSKSATKLLPAKTTVIAITGATLGKVSLLEINSCANQSVVGVLPNSNIPYEFIYPFVKHNILELISHQTGGAQQHINKQNVEQIKLYIPPYGILHQYQTSVKPIYKVIANNCFENTRLAELRDTLLPKLMSGEINVDDVKILADKSSFTGEI